jgi:hypothetical protein
MAPDRRVRRRRSWSLRARLAYLLGAVAAFLIVTLTLQLMFQNRLADERDDLIHRVDGAADAVGDLRSAVVLQQTGVRGHALSQGDEAFLEPYDEGRQQTADALDRLHRLLGDDESTEAGLDAATEAVESWEAGVLVPGIGRVEAGIEPDTARMGANATRFDDLQASIDDLDRAVATEREADLRQLDRAFSWVLIMIFVQIGGLVVLGAVIAVALSRQVIGPLARLGEDARKVAQGDLSRRVQRYGSANELIHLGADVEAMRVRIVSELELLTDAQESLERQQSELLRSNDDLEQFAYVASHDLQEPLRKVSGFCQLLERRYADELDDRAKEYIWYANDGARRMQDLINDLLAFSRVGRTTEEFEDVDLEVVANEVVAMFGEPIEAAGATVTVGALPTVEGDRRLLAQVIQNLVGNALKFRGKEPPEVRISSVDDGDTSIVSVADNGIGIPPEYADQIFTIFKRLHNKTEYDGTGIGLALSKKVVEFHGGRIWVEPSGETPGTTFSFSLPHRQVAAATVSATEASDHVHD